VRVSDHERRTVEAVDLDAVPPGMQGAVGGDGNWELSSVWGRWRGLWRLIWRWKRVHGLVLLGKPLRCGMRREKVLHESQDLPETERERYKETSMGSQGRTSGGVAWFSVRHAGWQTTPLIRASCSSILLRYLWLHIAFPVRIAPDCTDPIHTSLYIIHPDPASPLLRVIDSVTWAVRDLRCEYDTMRSAADEIKNEHVLVLGFSSRSFSRFRELTRNPP